VLLWFIKNIPLFHSDWKAAGDPLSSPVSRPASGAIDAGKDYPFLKLSPWLSRIEHRT
jgi:hypothetical protein